MERKLHHIGGMLPDMLLRVTFLIYFILQPSRVGADFSVEIFDWNQIEQAKSLGIAKIELADIEPFQAAERTLSLVSTKHGEKGQLRVRLMFQPEIIAKSRKNTSTFTSAGRAMTQIGALPVSAGRGVFQNVAGVFKRGDRDHDHHPVDMATSGQASQPVGVSDTLEAKSTFPIDAAENTHASTAEPGTLRVTVLDAKDLSTSESKSYVTIRVGDKEFKTKHTAKTATPEWSVFLSRSLLRLLNFFPGMSHLSLPLQH